MHLRFALIESLWTLRRSCFEILGIDLMFYYTKSLRKCSLIYDPTVRSRKDLTLATTFSIPMRQYMKLQCLSQQSWASGASALGEDLPAGEGRQMKRASLLVGNELCRAGSKVLSSLHQSLAELPCLERICIPWCGSSSSYPNSSDIGIWPSLKSHWSDTNEGLPATWVIQFFYFWDKLSFWEVWKASSPSQFSVLGSRLCL